MFRRKTAVLLMVLGALLIGVSLLLEGSALPKMVGGLLLGFGSATLSGGIGVFVLLVFLPEATFNARVAAKRIEHRDERNRMLLSKAGASVNSFMAAMLVGAIVVFGFLGVVRVVLVDLAALLVVQGIALVVCFNCYAKKL